MVEKRLSKVDLNQWNTTVFPMLRDEWTLITAGTGECCNTMTASWGGVGVLWGVPMATIYVRPPRFTKEFLDREEYFTLSFFGKAYRKELALCGKESGRDLDKFQECGFTVATGEGGAPYVGEAELVLVCKKAYVQAMNPEAMSEEVKEKWYPLKDYHHMYMGEVVEILQKQ